MYLSNEDIRRWAEKRGHFNLEVVPLPVGTWWKCTCSCGYQSTRRRTSAQAAQAAVHHLEKVIDEMVASGQSFAETA